MPQEVMGKSIETDVFIIGSGGAGLRAAIEAAHEGKKVIVATKGRLGKCGATLTAGADFNVDARSIREVLGFPGDTRDSPETFFEDTMVEGRWINSQKIVAALVTEAPQRVKEAVDWGLRLKGIAYPARPGNRYVRGVLAPGTEISSFLVRKVQELKQSVQIMDYVMITDLLTDNGQVIGAVGLDIVNGTFLVVRAKAVIIASGSGQAIYPLNTYPQEMSGDGQAMAYRAGAELLDMEFMQYCTCAFLHPYPPQSIIFALLHLSNGAWLLNRHGRRFIEKWDPVRKEDTSRCVICVAINDEILEGRGWSDERGSYVALSMGHLPEGFVEYVGEDYCVHHPHFDKACVEQYRKSYQQLKKNFVPVFAAPHSFLGGIRTDEYGRSSLRGLFAAGEVSGGLHGADRLAGNAITQCFVQGARAGKAAADFAAQAPPGRVNNDQLASFYEKVQAPLRRSNGVSPFELKHELEQIAVKKLSNVREGATLESAIGEITKLKKDVSSISTKVKDTRYNREWLDALEADSCVLVAEMIARSALMRTESRGNHYRKDFPAMNNEEWRKNIVIKRAGEEMQLRTEAPPATRSFSAPAKLEKWVTAKRAGGGI